jgi:MoCo/4Fe-4S cofactor protein with predicted Tat translocation signal
MSLDQCHSTVGEKPIQAARSVPMEGVGISPLGKGTQAGRLSHPDTQAGRLSHEAGQAKGMTFWRSLDEYADTPEFRDWLEKEFPAGASRLLETSRRDFVKLMGASVALAGAAMMPGCRRPDMKIMPYSKNVPEETIPGKPIYFATSMPVLGGGWGAGAEGLLIETHEGRPTKVEGNPLHPNNRGKSSLWAQASVLDLYDPDRLKDPVLIDSGDTARSWDDFAAWSKQHFAKFDATQGQGLVFLAEKISSPSRDAARDATIARWPKATWAVYDPTEDAGVLAGSPTLWGERPCKQVLDLSKARAIVSFDRDFLFSEPGMLTNARGFASTRKAMSTKDEMSRLYVVESRYTMTGGKADHRVRLAPSQIGVAVALVAKAVMAKLGGGGGGGGDAGALGAALGSMSATVPAGMTEAGLDAQWIDACADDLVANKGRCVVLCGTGQPSAAHAMCHLLNVALGNVGATVSYLEMSSEEATKSSDELAKVARMLEGGGVDTIVCLGVNPVYDAPGELDFGKKFAKAGMRVTLDHGVSETVSASNWRLPKAHYLESWGDTRSADGTIAPIQPMIAPLYGAKSEIEALAIIRGAKETDGYALVRGAWRDAESGRAGSVDAEFEKRWRRVLHDGVATGTIGQSAARPIDRAKLEAWATGLISGFKPAGVPGEGALDVVFCASNIGSGAQANNGWLHELPEAASHLSWDNAAFVSPRTAEALGLSLNAETAEVREARMADLAVGGRTLRIAVWPTPGVAENTVVLPLGYGRTVVGRVGEGVGFNTYAVRPASGAMSAGGATLKAANDGERWYRVASTQQHGSMEGRAILREVDVGAYRAYGDDPYAGMSEQEKQRLATDSYGRTRDMNFGERLGELAHTPANESIYTNPYNLSRREPDTSQRTEKGLPPAYSVGPQWGMSIDLATCIGCNTCTIACQAENNIPIVGKREVQKGREMHWIRVDRYFMSDASEAHGTSNPQGMSFQPVACVHCENAPCETVCPVNATVHGPEGINYMVYNRCIGTRYCANNCPYKVRRFNFFDFAVAKYRGEYLGKEALDKLPSGGPDNNPNFVPPRLREKLDEVTKLGMNPDVTVRSRGVMEKCSYCLQRINEARVEAKLKNLPGIPDGMFQTACQQACPSDAISFGDKLDTKTSYDGGKRTGSRLSIERNHARSYLLLGFLNTRPRTTYLVGLRNPNPRIRPSVDHPFHHGAGAGDEGGEGHGASHAEKPAGGHALLAEPAGDSRRSALDAGLKYSLRVLGGTTA